MESHNALKKLAPVVQIETFEFEKHSRRLKLTFLETQQYRTIEKYVTKNYQKNPIFSDWKTRSKEISKIIKLDNETLENLQNNKDQLIVDFCYEIIKRLNDSDLRPSWFLIGILKNEYSKKINHLKSYISSHYDVARNIKHWSSIRIKKLVDENNDRVSTIECNNELIKKIDIKIASRQKRNFWIFLLTLGFYCFLTSNKAISKLHRKKELLLFENDLMKQTNLKSRSQVEKLRDEIRKAKLEAEEAEKKINKKIEELRLEEASQLEKIEALPFEVSLDDSKFIAMDRLSGMNKKKIVGCYVIRNNENRRIYVGQSKDVFKRLGQHFFGTKPKNMIFAEDYYSSNQRESLFSVMIIPCETKDELDSTEKELIARYEANSKGYNSTSGNS